MVPRRTAELPGREMTTLIANREERRRRLKSIPFTMFAGADRPHRSAQIAIRAFYILDTKPTTSDVNLRASNRNGRFIFEFRRSGAKPDADQAGN
jgi:hypothetical protein